MIFRNFLLPGVLVPALSAAVTLLVLGWLGRFKSSSSGASVAGEGGAAAAIAFLAAYVAISGWPRWLPVEASQRLFFLVAVSALVALAIGLWRPRRAAWIIQGVLFAALLFLLLQTPLEHWWSAGQAVLWLAGLFILLVALDLGVSSHFGSGAMDSADDNSAGEDKVDRAASLTSSVIRLSLFAIAALALGLSGSARLAQLMGALACGVLVVEAAGRLRRGSRWRSNDGPVVAIIVFGLLLIGYFYAELRAWPAVLLVGSFGLLGLSPRVGKRWWIASLLPALIALTLAVITFINREADPYDYGHLQEMPRQESSDQDWARLSRTRRS